MFGLGGLDNTRKKITIIKLLILLLIVLSIGCIEITPRYVDVSDEQNSNEDTSPPDEEDYFKSKVYWIWNIQADIIPDPVDGLCIHYWNLKINGEIKDEEYPYIDRPCWMWNGTGPRPYTPSEHIWYSWDTTGDVYVNPMKSLFHRNDPVF